MIWFIGHITRFSTIVWLAIKDRLSRLSRFGLRDHSRCSLCDLSQETHEHLFFECPFSSGVWKELSRKYEVNWGGRPWRDWISFSSSTVKANLLFRILLELCLPSVFTVYGRRGIENF